MGRPPKYSEWTNENGQLRIEEMSRDGFTDMQIAESMGISVRSFYGWRKKYSEIENAYQKGRAPVNVKVENAVLESALGYTRTVKKPIKLRREIGKTGGPKKIEEYVEYVEEEIFVPANPAAQKLWLINRKREKWGTGTDVNVTIDGENEALNEIRALMEASRKDCPPQSPPEAAP